MNGGNGRCLCGTVRYEFDGRPNWQAHCHCASCRRNCAAPFTSYFGITHGKWRWTGETPAIYRSSAGVKRHFCATCGTPMAYEGERWAHEIHFYAAGLEDPAAFAPEAHVNWNEHLPWVQLCDELPVYRTPRRLSSQDNAVAVLDLLRQAFGYMDGIIDPPSSLHRLSADEISRQAEDGEVWVLEELPQVPVACAVLSPTPDGLYIGKLAVADGYRRQGLARQLINHAASRARALGLPKLVLNSRIELAANHTAFAALGFEKTGTGTHEGYDRPTYFIFERGLE